MFRTALTSSRLLIALLVTVAVGLPISAATATTGGQATAVRASPVRLAVAPTCFDTTCKGKDPQTTHCGDDATTIDEFSGGSGHHRVELRYSAKCYAAWTRVTMTWTEGWRCNSSFAQIRGYDANDNRLGLYYVQATCPGQRYTKMWPYHNYVRACSATTPTGDPASCTARH